MEIRQLLAGKMVEVQAGPSAKKVRHNKVSTAKGPRDRRVRLSADTAIKFYDVQDRLGCERASEAVDWLIQKAKGSIDKLLIDSSSQHFEHQTHLGAQNESHGNFYHAKSMLERREFEEAAVYQSCQHNRVQNLINVDDHSTQISRYNCVDGSMLFPYSHMGNCSRTLEHNALPSCQQILEKGQMHRMLMFNSKSSSRSGEHPFMSNSVPIFLQNTAALADKNDLCSVHSTMSGQSEATAHQPSETESNGPSSDELARYYISAQSHHQYQEQIEAFNQPSFFMPASRHG